MQNDIICFVNEVYNRILKSYNIFHSTLYTILLLKSYIMTIQWFQAFMLKIQYDFEFKVQLWKIINPQSTIFWKSNFHWTYVIKYCRKLNAKMIAVFFRCVVRADTRGNVNREQNKWHRAPIRLESGGTLFPRKITPLRSHCGKVNRCDYIICIEDEKKIKLTSFAITIFSTIIFSVQQF